MSPTTLAAYPTYRSGHRDPAPPMPGSTPMFGGLPMLGGPSTMGLPMLSAAPRLPTHGEFFTGLRSILDNLEQATRPPTSVQPAPAHHGRHGHEHRHAHGCGCGGGHECGCGHEHRHPPGCDCDCGCGTWQGRGGGWGHARGHDCGCGPEQDCGCGRGYECGCGRRERCACRCCVDDADLIVQARLGEHRVIPIEIANERRRERDVELELSEFRRSSGGDAPVSGALDPTRLHLDPCGEQSAVLTLELPLGEKTGEREPDVDECLTAYADLRLTGCEIRPLRIAVVILPRVCDAHLVECGCGCC
jgi:hypothetical protein